MIEVAKCSRVTAVQFAPVTRWLPHFWLFLRLHISSAKNICGYDTKMAELESK